MQKSSRKVIDTVLRNNQSNFLVLRNFTLNQSRLSSLVRNEKYAVNFNNFLLFLQKLLACQELSEKTLNQLIINNGARPSLSIPFLSLGGSLGSSLSMLKGENVKIIFLILGLFGCYFGNSVSYRRLYRRKFGRAVK